MASKPNAKYDWPKYLPKMVDLYKTGMSIPKIHTEIQDPANGFTPSLSILYAKFRSENYSTEYTRATLLDPVKSTTGSGILTSHDAAKSIKVLTQPSTANINPSLVAQNNLLHPSDSTFTRTHKSTPDHMHNNAHLSTTNMSGHFDGFEIGSNIWNLNPTQQIQDSGPPASASLQDLAWAEFNLGNDYGEQYIIPDPWVAEIPYSTLNMQSANSGFSTMPPSNISQQLSESDTITEHRESSKSGEPSLTYPDECRDSGMKLHEYEAQLPSCHAKRQHRSYDSTSLPEESGRAKRNSSPAIESVTTRIVSWGKRGFNRSVSPDNRLSGSPRDSGYASGRSSLLVPIAEDTPPHPNSLNEFKGLYRVPCHGLHESPSYNRSYDSHPKDRFKNTPTCDHCQYSGIHNVSWSAKCLEPAEFKSELKRDRLYDIFAIDAAGNSALHYAAVGGAGYEQLLSLIEAGVNPYRINTLGQLFLHCLRPGSDSISDPSIALFNIDLVNLLNLLEPRGAVAALRWRDNEGRTVLDALAAQMTGSEMKKQTFQRIKDAGYPVEISRQFGNFQAQNRKSNLQQPTPGTDTETSPGGLDREFAANQERQDKAYAILGRASVEPSYVDPETGDNILHALSRLRLPERGSLLAKIQDFVAKDVDLNVHNKERDSPLAAFIRERPFLGVESDETGATMSKYLDALLWKDARRRIPNKINVNMKNREGATALYYAATRARPDSVRSLIEAGANVNARIDVDGQRISILHATRNAKAVAVFTKDELKIHLFDNVISYLEHDGAISNPTVMEERRVCENSVRIMPM